MKNRRTPEGYKLRVYMDELSEVKSMSDDQWMTKWVKHVTKDSVYVNKACWISYLENCIINEVGQFLKRAA